MERFWKVVHSRNGSELTEDLHVTKRISRKCFVTEGFEVFWIFKKQKNFNYISLFVPEMAATLNWYFEIVEKAEDLTLLSQNFGGFHPWSLILNLAQEPKHFLFSCVFFCSVPLFFEIADLQSESRIWGLQCACLFWGFEKH